MLGERISNAATMRWLGSMSNGTLYSMSKNAFSLKQWKLVPVNEFYYVLTDLNDKCLETNHQGIAFTSNCTRMNSQLWKNVEGNLINKETSNCLSSEADGEILTRPCDNSLNQVWLIEDNFLGLP